ncbi:MAG TPA: DUF1587 domain-containing protein [Polyangiaceae bacterium]|jgi:hypothetical protein|nr:DUF1587 domain-containing protein [Polyangiaceae bacterium]
MPRRAFRPERASLIAALALSVAACTGRIGDSENGAGPHGSVNGPHGPNGTASGPDAGSGMGAPSSSGGGGASSVHGDSGTTTQGLDCTTPAVGATPLVRLNRGHYANAVRDLLHLTTLPDVSDLAEDERVGPFAGNTVAPVSELVVEQYMTTAENIARAAASNLAGLVACDRSAMGDTACAAQFIDTFGRRVYRRPLTDDEKSAYTALYATAFVSSCRRCCRPPISSITSSFSRRHRRVIPSRRSTRTSSLRGSRSS